MGNAKSKPLLTGVGMRYISICEANHPGVRRLVAFLRIRTVEKNALTTGLDWYKEVDDVLQGGTLQRTGAHSFFPHQIECNGA